MASKRQRSNGSWEFVVKRHNLLPKPIHLTFADEAEGDAYCDHLEKLLDANIIPEEFKKTSKAIITIGQAIIGYTDAVHITDDDVAILGHLRHSLGKRTLDKADYPWAEQWIRELQASGAAPSTIRKKVGALARCFDWLVRRKNTMLVANPLRMLPKRYATTATGRKDVERDRRLLPGINGQDDEETRILAILDRMKPEGRERPLALPHADALRLMFVIALDTAMRMREIYTLGRAQANIEKRTFFLEKTKNGDKRQVPMSSAVVSALQKYLEGKTDGNLFPFWDGETTPAKLRATTTRLSQQWGRIFSAAKCPGLTFHDLRHESTSRLYERTDLSDVEIAKITGHKSLRMLMRYSNLRGSDLAKRMW